MYYICYPQPGGTSGEYCVDTAGTKEEAVEAAERLAAQYTCADRSEYKIFEESTALLIPSQGDKRRCPLCGEVIGTEKLLAGAVPEYDNQVSDCAVDADCPHCGGPLKAVFDGEGPGAGFLYFTY